MCLQPHLPRESLKQKKRRIFDQVLAAISESSKACGDLAESHCHPARATEFEIFLAKSLDAILPAYAGVSFTLSLTDFLSRAVDAKNAPENVAIAIRARAAARDHLRLAHTHLLKRLRIDPAQLADLKVLVVEALDEPYPPEEHHVAATAEIHNQWSAHLRNIRLKDDRFHRVPVHQLDPSKIRHTIGPGESFIIRDSNGVLVGVVLRRFCCDGRVLNWANEIVLEATEVKKSARLDDPGKLPIIGFSAGSRSPGGMFDWVKNLLRKHAPGYAQDLDHRTSSVFAVLWNIAKCRLPPEVYADLQKWVAENDLPRMSRSMSRDEGSYTIDLGDQQFTFHNVELAPPQGVMAANYCRGPHTEAHPHNFGMAWTTGFQTDPAVADSGGDFYFAKYGIRVKPAANTLVAWKPTELHGTGLQHRDPKDANPVFMQTGAAIVTSMRLATRWKAYRKGLVARAALAAEVAAADAAEIAAASKQRCYCQKCCGQSSDLSSPESD